MSWALRFLRVSARQKEVYELLILEKLVHFLVRSDGAREGSRLDWSWRSPR